MKLFVIEPETAALRDALRGWPRTASAALLQVELIRSIRRSGSTVHLAEARRFLGGIHLVRLTDALLDRAALLDPVLVRSLDSIHLAAALGLGGDLGVVVTYDGRMIDAAASLGLATISPR